MRLGTEFLTPSVSGGSGGNLIEEGGAVITALGSPVVVFDGDENLSVNTQDWIVGILCTATAALESRTIQFTSCANLLAAGFIGVTGLAATSLLDFTSSGLQSISFDALTTINASTLVLTSNDLGEIEFPILTTFHAVGLSFNDNPLVDFRIPLLTTLSGSCSISFQGCALPTAKVDAICTKFAAADSGATGIIDFSGGTNGKPTVVLTTPNIDNGGILYVDGDNVVATGTGTGFNCTVVVDGGGTITGFNLNNPGSGYTSDTTFDVTSITGGGAMLSPVYSDNAAILTLKNSGAGFTVTTN